jgi:hypothetical protein
LTAAADYPKIVCIDRRHCLPPALCQEARQAFYQLTEETPE